MSWIQRGPIAPWMEKYCIWLAQQPEAVLSRALRPGERAIPYRGRPYTQERTAAASRMACRKIRKEMIQELERRPDFVEMFDKFRADASYLAKRLGVQQIVTNFEAREEGLELARAGKDVKAIETYTRPFVELAFPKKVDGAEQAPRVVIHLNSGDAKQLLLGQTQPLLASGGEEALDVEYEVIPAKPAEEAEDE